MGLKHLRLAILLTQLAILVHATPLDSHASSEGRGLWDILLRRDARPSQFSPKVFIISMFDPEAQIWYEAAGMPGSFGNLLAVNITVPGLSPRYPQVHCIADGSVCQVTTCEAEINAASTLTALTLSTLFNLKKTYFLIGGIGGINPKQGTLADVAFPKYAVQVALQYEIDAREIPQDFSTGYFSFGTDAPNEYPLSIYGTEVFEVNEALRDIAVSYARTVKLNDSTDAIAYRTSYNSDDQSYNKALRTPSIITCDVATSDAWFSGRMLGEAFENTTTLLTNGSATYCITAMEDNATLAALLRASMRSTVDFSRIIIMRSGSNFDRQPPNSSAIHNLIYANQGGFVPAIENLFIAGNPIVKGILADWTLSFEKGIAPTNYVGDIFRTLGGNPDFGPGEMEFGVVIGPDFEKL
ncbi:purine nucleoside permease-domain-containing protein [Calycina marina]|uniref:Purine nucleoside permease-domain-containing protein n=1 Tax=Calycina marina TaxID=1763456 RepID=A0A9P8CJ27_9HELO|nr:purine nucleoside permease-domain-containing protein [Calycina marina]